MEIAIVDDEKIYRDEIDLYLKQMSIKEKCEITFFSNGIDFIKDLEVNKYDIVFLDIELQDMLGVDIAKNILNSNEECKIFFVTSHTGYISEAFKLAAFQYIIKPINEVLFKEEVKRAIKAITDSKLVVECIWSGVSAYVEANDIVYIENRDRKSYLITKNGEKRSCLRLANYFLKLKPYNFVQTHNSFVVNLKYVKNKSDNSLILLDDIEIPISKQYLPAVKEKFREYISGVVL